ncbi:MAG: ABC transporter permease [Oscillospiraceae bacterium]|nr:ABC transporter permease [Oscillospiraceae bacterium]
MTGTQSDDSAKPKAKTETEQNAVLATEEAAPVQNDEATQNTTDNKADTYSGDAATTKAPKKTRKKEPLIQISKRAELGLYKKFILYALAVFAALAVGGIFIAANGANPFEYYIEVITGCFKSPLRIKGFLRLIMPLIITSIGISFAFKMRFWNIGANGQFIMGALAATTVSLAIGDSLPQWITLIIMAAAGCIGGALFGLIPALLKVKFGTNETLLTLMLNYIALYLIMYFKNVYFYRTVNAQGEVLFPEYKALPKSGWMYELKIGAVTFDVSLIIAIVIVVLAFIYYRYTKQGYEIAVVGDSKNTARYAGMSVSKIMIRTMLISAALVGLAGMFQVASVATSHTLSDGISHDVGWTGIIVAWLSKLNPFGILITSCLMGVLEQGCNSAESVFPTVSPTASDILEGIILFTVLAADFFIRYSIRFPGIARKVLKNNNDDINTEQNQITEKAESEVRL